MFQSIHIGCMYGLPGTSYTKLNTVRKTKKEIGFNPLMCIMYIKSENRLAGMVFAAFSVVSVFVAVHCVDCDDIVFECKRDAM